MISRTPSIGVLILSRNNESTILATINSVAHIARQVVVMDTGSTDNTPLISRKSGAEVYFFEWVNDFSAARNHALQFLHTDWVLVLDSDELLNDFDIYEFQKVASNNSIGGINVLIQNTLANSEGNTTTTHRYTRLFRRHDKIKFSGKIHEQIRESIESQGFMVFESDFSIIHLGYADNKKEKFDRNIGLITQEVSDNPNDDWLRYHLAVTNFAAGKLDDADEIFRKIMDSDYLTVEQNEIVKIRLAQIALSRDNYPEVVNFTEFYSQNPDNEALRNYVRGTGFVFFNNKAAALDCLSKTKEINSPALSDSDVDRVLNFAQNMKQNI